MRRLRLPPSWTATERQSCPRWEPPAPVGQPEPTAGQSAPAAPAAAPQTRAKTKGVADIVFLIDVSGSMAPIIDALRKNIEAFVDSLSQGDANNAAPGAGLARQGRRLSRHRGGAVRRAAVDRGQPVRARRRRAQGAARRRCEAQGGGDEPESLLDALYKVATMEASPKGAQSEEPGKWRYRSDAARVVVVFTDASFKETMSIPEAKGGALQDVANVVMANRIILSLFAPNFEGYDRLSQIDKTRVGGGGVRGAEPAGGAAEVHLRSGQLPHHAQAARRQRVAVGRDRRALRLRSRPDGTAWRRSSRSATRSAATASRRCSARG